MNTQQILTEIHKLTPYSQKQLLNSLSRSLDKLERSFTAATEEEVDRLLLADGVISEVPSGWNEADEDFEPILISGEPLSETIIRERG